MTRPTPAPAGATKATLARVAFVVLGLPLLPSYAGATDAAERARAVCAACHGPTGHASMPSTPSLAGQPKVFLENQLVMIREGLREIAAMKGLLDKLADADLIALATWYAAQPQMPAGPPTGTPDAAAIERGGTLAKQALCGTCHLPTYRGQSQVPRLAGQREDYLQQTMVLMRDGKAQGRDSIMAATLRGMSDGQLQDMAKYFTEQR